MTPLILKSHPFFLKALKIMKDATVAAESVDYLDFNPDEINSDAPLFGLKVEDLLHNYTQRMVIFFSL